MLTAHHPDDQPPPANRRLAVEITALLILAAVGLIVFAFAVQACA